MLFNKKRKNPDEFKPIFNIADESLRELVATFLVVFAIASFMHISTKEVLAMHSITLHVFYGLFFGASLFIFDADMNPAITFARWVRGLINFTELFARWMSQFIAALAAIALVKLMGGTADQLMWSAEGLTAIDIVVSEGFFIAILITIMFANYKKTYRPVVFATIFIFIQIMIGSVLVTKLNFLFIIAPTIIFNQYSWQITFFAIAHLGAVAIMVATWIKDSKAD